MIPTSCKPDASRSPNPSVVVYCSVDEAYAKPILEAFEKESGIVVAAIYDSEAGKTTGLVNRIAAESHSGRVRADVFWSGELFNTIRLARENHLDPYASPAASDIPVRFRDKDHRWTGLAARARVLSFDSARTPIAAECPDWEMLSSEPFASRVAIANPLFGTTRGHVAAMFALWGEERGRTFLKRLRDGGALVVDGNSAAVRSVLSGRSDFAMTDSDDVLAARRENSTLDLCYPDMGNGGTLMIPSTVGLICGGPNPAEARRLVDYLVSADVERKLLESDSRNVPVRETLRAEMKVPWPAESEIPIESIVNAMEASDRAVREILIR